MDTKVSEATVETAQVEEKPSEETQVAEPTPSEAVPPVQEPVEEKPPEESLEERKERIRKEILESEEGKAALQSEADKRALKLRQEFEGREREQQRKTQQEAQLRESQQKRERDLNTYRQLQALEQTKPDEWRQYMRDPQYAAIWNQGLNTTPSTMEIDSARGDGYNEGFNQLWGNIYQGFMSAAEMAELTTEELSELSSDNFKGVPNPHAAYTLALAKVYGMRLARKGFSKELEKAVEDARADEREKLQSKYREAGVEPTELEGTGAPAGVLTKARYAAMTPEARAALPPEEIDAMVKRETGV